MALVRVTVVNEITGAVVLPTADFDTEHAVQQAKAALRKALGRRIKLLHNGAAVDAGFRARPGQALTFGVVALTELITKEERERYLATLRGLRFSEVARVFSEFPEDARDDRELVLRALELNCVSSSYWADDSLFCFRFASVDCRSDSQIVLSAVRQNPRLLRFAGDRTRNEREIVMAAVERAPTCLEFAGDRLRNDREVVALAVRQSPRCLKFAGPDCRSDQDIVMLAVSRDPRCLKLAGSCLRQDRESVLRIVAQQPRCLQFVESPFRNDQEIVMSAVQQHAYLLDFASRELRDKFLDPWHSMPDGNVLSQFIADPLDWLMDSDWLMSQVSRDPWLLDWLLEQWFLATGSAVSCRYRLPTFHRDIVMTSGCWRAALCLDSDCPDLGMHARSLRHSRRMRARSGRSQRSTCTSSCRRSRRRGVKESSSSAAGATSGAARRQGRGRGREDRLAARDLKFAKADVYD